MATRKQTDAETWKLLRDAAAREEAEEIAKMPPAEVDRELAAAGIDPAKLRQEGRAQIAKLRERHERLGWQMAANAKLESVRERAKALAGRYAGLPRAELVARVEAARNDARFGGQVSALFRKRGEGESSDDDLRTLLEELDLLADVQGGGSGKDGA